MRLDVWKKNVYILLFFVLLLVSPLSVLGDSFDLIEVTELFLQSINEPSSNLNQDFPILAQETKSLKLNLNPQEAGHLSSKEISTELSRLLNQQETSIQSLKEKWNQLEIFSKTLSDNNEQLEAMLQSSKAELNALSQNLENAKKALESNKEDTSFAIQEIAELFNQTVQLEKDIDFLKEKINYLENKNKSSTIAGLLFGAGIGAGITLGIIGIINSIESQSVDNLVPVGFGLSGGLSVVYFCGKFLIKLW